MRVCIANTSKYILPTIQDPWIYQRSVNVFFFIQPAGKSTGRDTPVLDETKRAGQGSPHTRSSRKLKVKY